MTVDKGRIEDLLRLAVKADQPPLTGAINFKTKFDLPPGQGDLSDRLNLDGKFDVGAGAIHQPGGDGKNRDVKPESARPAGKQECGQQCLRAEGKLRTGQWRDQFPRSDLYGHRSAGRSQRQVRTGQGRPRLSRQAADAGQDFADDHRSEVIRAEGCRSLFPQRRHKPRCRSRLPASGTTPPSASISDTKRKKKKIGPSAHVAPASRRLSRGHPALSVAGRMPSRQPPGRRRYSKPAPGPR